MVNEVTEKQIIYALERCPQHTECCYCNAVEECGNKKVLTESVLALINRQKAEIDILIRKKETLRDEISQLQNEVETWKRTANYNAKKYAELVKELGKGD